MAEEALILALDQGTTSSRAALVDASGLPIAMEAEAFRQIYPQPGRVEHDPEEIWQSQLTAMNRLLGSAPRGARDRVAGIGLTNQRETTLLWRRSDGMPLHNAIVWQDRRTASRCERLREERGAEWVASRTGLLPDPYFSATKLEWLLDNVPGARELAGAGELAFGTVDTWLLWKLTSGQSHLTDRTNASRTMLWNLGREEWDESLLAEFNIPRSLLPEVLPSAALFGRAGTAEAAGLSAPICGIAGDQQAALFGQAGWRSGIAKNTYGTGCFLLLQTGADRPLAPAGLLATAAAAHDGGRAYAVEGSVFIAGAAIQWLRDELGLIKNAAESEELAQSIPDSGGVYLVPAFAGLGAPYWDPRARGVVCGLTRGAGRAQLTRAALESIAYQTADVVEAMAAAGRPVERLRVDGGASANNFLMQFQADILGIPVERAACAETTVMGAAYLAGLGCGLWQSGELEQLWRCDRVFEPDIDAGRRDELLAGWRRAVDRSRDWARD